MANTLQSAKRARQNDKRRTKNMIIRTATKSSIRAAIEAIQTKDQAKATTYLNAVKALSKAASKGAIPKARAARKISRLTHLLQTSK